MLLVVQVCQPGAGPLPMYVPIGSPCCLLGSVVSCLARQLGPLRPSIIRSLRGPLVLSEALLLLRFQPDPRHALLIWLEVAESAVHKLRPSQAFQKRHCWLQAHLQRPKPPTNLKW